MSLLMCFFRITKTSKTPRSSASLACHGGTVVLLATSLPLRTFGSAFGCVCVCVCARWRCQLLAQHIPETGSVPRLPCPVTPRPTRQLAADQTRTQRAKNIQRKNMRAINRGQSQKRCRHGGGQKQADEALGLRWQKRAPSHRWLRLNERKQLIALLVRNVERESLIVCAVASRLQLAVCVLARKKKSFPWD